MTTPAGSRLLGAALALTLAGCAWLALRPDDAVVDAVRVRQPAAVRAPATTVPARLAAAAPAAWPNPALRTEATNAVAAWPLLGDGASAAWSAPAAHRAGSSAVVATAPAAPVAEVPPPPPRFPFTFIGRWDGDAAARRLVLLAGPQRTYAVGAGDVVDGQWRIDRVSADSFSVTFVPQGSVQTVSIRPS